MDEWSQALRHFEERYISFYTEIVHFLETLTPEELEELRKECRKASPTNCSWALYEVATKLIPLATSGR